MNKARRLRSLHEKAARDGTNEPVSVQRHAEPVADAPSVAPTWQERLDGSAEHNEVSVASLGGCRDADAPPARPFAPKRQEFISSWYPRWGLEITTRVRPRSAHA